jgi:hypothetical protein
VPLPGATDPVLFFNPKSGGCIRSGTRKRTVDLAEVNGRVFVNVSLGLYAEAAQADGYREAKLRTILDTVPDVLGPEGRRIRPALVRTRGSEHSSGAAILVSNNHYRLGKAVGSGTRPKIEDGLLGITVAASRQAAKAAVCPHRLASHPRGMMRGAPAEWRVVLCTTRCSPTSRARHERV